MINPSELIDEDGVPLYFTKANLTEHGVSFEDRKVEVFEQLTRMYDKE